ncbi:acidobacterial duplicated orphan permease [Clostridium sp. N3C]|uniref:ABC transporter permease n=1 Tax=Clostridium sp. N3C TaxID=1776758 RepID=UPI00092E1616|nr:ABC transporter permease [Clostridium sp. N3C]SCN25462.1 acidobacterial duplicated orphan permease [Clostridium sp. N3C]
MLKFLLKRIKHNLLAYLLILIGYVFSILIISIGTSLCQNSMTLSLDYTHGKINHQKEIEVSRIDNKNIDYSKLAELVCKYSSNLNIDILGITDTWDYDDIKNAEVIINPVVYQEDPEWLPTISQGRFLTAVESQSNEKVTVIGDAIAFRLFPKGINENSYINLGNEKFKVIGVAGTIEKGEDYLSTVYLPIKTLPSKYKEGLEKLNIRIMKNSDSPDVELKEMMNELSHSKIAEASEVDISYSLNELYITYRVSIFAGIIVLFIAISNIVSFTSYLMFKRRREFAISRILGASDRQIGLSLFGELLCISIISSFVVFLLHMLLNPIIHQKFDEIVVIKYFIIDYVNLITVFLLSLIVTVLISIINYRKVIKMDLNQEIKIE